MSATVWVVSPKDNPHVAAFSELADSLVRCLIELGYGAFRTKDPDCCRGLTIVLGAHLLKIGDTLPPGKFIIFNLEQLDRSSPWWTQDYREILKIADAVFDYSPRNKAFLKAHLNINAIICPIGHHEVMQKRSKDVQKDIDLLFIGSMNARREKILLSLQQYGITPLIAVNVYGDERDQLIKRAKINLNLHYYEAKIFEVVRCSMLLAQGAIIVSEFGEDKLVEQPYYDKIVFAKTENIGKACRYILDNESVAKQIWLKSHKKFTKMKQSTYLKKALAIYETRRNPQQESLHRPFAAKPFRASIQGRPY